MYRLDGDEFAVVARGDDAATLPDVYQALHQSFRRQQTHEGKKFYCTLSAGCAQYPADAETYEDLVKFANYALEYAKAHGKKRRVPFSPSILAERSRTLELVERLRDSIEHDFEGFRLVFQPQVNAADGRVIGAEALARWSCDACGEVPPLEFIPLLEESGLTPGEDVNVEFMDSETLMTQMAAGEYEVCMLPVPAVTSVLMQNQDVRVALDLTDEWNKVTDEGVLTMGCIVVRTEFAQENPEAVKAFLEEYAASIESVQSDVEHASQLCETYGIVAKAAVAAKAIPDCNLCCVTGADIQTSIEPYYNVLYAANADSIGGALPGEDFYFVAE